MDLLLDGLLDLGFEVVDLVVELPVLLDELLEALFLGVIFDGISQVFAEHGRVLALLLILFLRLLLLSLVSNQMVTDLRVVRLELSQLLHEQLLHSVQLAFEGVYLLLGLDILLNEGALERVDLFHQRVLHFTVFLNLSCVQRQNLLLLLRHLLLKGGDLLIKSFTVSLGNVSHLGLITESAGVAGCVDARVVSGVALLLGEHLRRLVSWVRR
mmetsp:Transcript_30593/g.46918  ORF Transcript_30593/g.46918 Transcript_30593/m.46918 type:complete len:213 (-) Transcript_30593:1462-2100(-)